MPTTSVQECKRQWDAVGWCVIEDVLSAAEVSAAAEALPHLFPTASEFADDVDPDRNAAFRRDGAPQYQFPFDSAALNQCAVGEAMLDLAATLLETNDVRLYQAMAVAKYANASPEHEQLLHVDYANHTLVVPRADVGFQHLETFVYLTDVTPETAATRFVSRELTGDIPIERTYLHLHDYADLYAAEECAVGPAGSVLVYRPDTFHRGVQMTKDRAARFMLAVAFKPALTDWIGYHALPARAEDMSWHRFMRHATARQLNALGFPQPGDRYWTPETLAGVAARYPSLDMTPWQSR